MISKWQVSWAVHVAEIDTSPTSKDVHSKKLLRNLLSYYKYIDGKAFKHIEVDNKAWKYD